MVADLRGIITGGAEKGPSASYEKTSAINDGDPVTDFALWLGNIRICL